jgi:transcriptional regulator with PAS, ATPase and Fis domain
MGEAPPAPSSFQILAVPMHTVGTSYREKPAIAGLIGKSRVIQKVIDLTHRAAGSMASVLLLGETGTGKELLANALHQNSTRSAGPLVKVNCGALTESLLESELFGHVAGSFTGAVGNRTGRFEAAHMGTIFLDEINSTSSMLQVKLLRVLQEKEFERVGDTRTMRVDVRVIAASNLDLYQEVSEGNFRADLFWRLNVMPIQLPPLRNRREDIPLLVDHFLAHYNRLNGRDVTRVHPEAMQALQGYSWPGNVRELQNYIERAVILSDGRELTADLLPGTVSGAASAHDSVYPTGDPQKLIKEYVFQEIATAQPDEQLYSRVVEPLEKELLTQVMQSCKSKTQAAERLGINRNTLHKKLKDFGLDKSGDR